MAHGNLYEWKAKHGKNWYPINRQNVICITKHFDRNRMLHNKYERSFWNHLLKGETLEVDKADYSRQTKVLILNVENIRVKTGEVK